MSHSNRIGTTPSILCVVALALPVAGFGSETATLVSPAAPEVFSAEEGCSWSVARPGLERIRHNAHYLAGPAPDQDWAEWLQDLGRYRQAVREGMHDPGRQKIEMSFDGVRAYVRTRSDWALAADLAPGERAEFRGQVRWLEGNNWLGIAFDWCDRTQGADGAWQGWSGMVAATSVPNDRQWHAFRISVVVPEFAVDSQWARPILGMDGTFKSAKSKIEIRNLSLAIPRIAERVSRWEELQEALPDRVHYDDDLYERPDLKWMARNFVCGFIFAYDRAFWDPERRVYRVEALCDDGERQFGGYDSIVLWPAYPRIGADDRNQFDFFRDMPGGLAGVGEAVERFQKRGVRVFLPYNPWDMGTRREPVPDDEALARLISELGADGIFRDTMSATPPGLREAVDAVRPGVVFAPEGHPALAEIERCNGSWAQWLRAFPEIGVLHLKWIEPRHMQHQIRRWDDSHRDELAAAWLNGSGILVWENVFGSWNPWNVADRAALRRMAPVLRQFAEHFSEGDWLPFYPVATDGVFSSCWVRDDIRLWTLVNRNEAPSEAVLEVDDQGETFFDLWRGEPIEPEPAGDRQRIRVSVAPFGAVAAVPGTAVDGLAALLERQRREAERPLPAGPDDHMAAAGVVEPREPPPCAAANPRAARGMLHVPRGETAFTVRHMRRECGCYPDDGTPEDERWRQFLAGNPHSQTIEHHVTRTLGPFWIDPEPVTNSEFAAFLRATGYIPACPDKFLHHWGGDSPPKDLLDEPVVYVDLDDARAYAGWAKRRLPTEWEWQRAVELHGEAMEHQAVQEWTESQRDDGHNRFVMLRGGCKYKAEGSIWYFPGGIRPVDSHAKFLLLDSGLDRCATIGFRCALPGEPPSEQGEGGGY